MSSQETFSQPQNNSRFIDQPDPKDSRLPVNNSSQQQLKNQKTDLNPSHKKR